MSGVIDPAVRQRIEDGLRPRADYLELSEALDGALILDRAAARRVSGSVGRILERVAGANVLMAWMCFRARSRFDVVFTDGEQVGIPFALLCRVAGRRGVRHVMIVHIVSGPKKEVPLRLFGLCHAIDVFITYSSRQTRFLRERIGVEASQVFESTFMVDTEFFSPERVEAVPRRMICAVGLEFRDYPTLIKAVDGLDIEVVIAAASPWSKRGDSTADVPLPPNVQVCSLDPVALRQLYADSEFLVMPLYDVDFQAGVTSLLEAMSMGKAVICSRTAGQQDLVREGETGLYVPPGDPAALRGAIESLLADPERARRLGEAGRRHVSAHCDVAAYAERLASLTSATRAP